jgi:taspase (threonine aspartase 1)
MGCDDDEVNMVDDFDYYGASEFDASSDKDAVRDSGTDDAAPQHVPNAEDADRVTDTVGAIAIDLQGNIAAGSSSGGIGMKHRGRTGPAALVGVGTAVVPQDPDDDLGTSVAAVTSGTGEHMATCSASLKCAERLFQGTRRGPGGRDIAEDDEHAILESFIVDDFMGHPGVRDQPSAGAIGVMAVKKDRTGVYFYFAHNTDSFALASMASNEREPLCVMSRLGKTGNVAQGGRRVRVE